MPAVYVTFLVLWDLAWATKQNYTGEDVARRVSTVGSWLGQLVLCN